jgi:hypothetical protein
VLDGEADRARLVELRRKMPVVHGLRHRQMTGQSADQFVIALRRLLMMEDTMRLRR